MKTVKVAFAGFRHPHIFSLYNALSQEMGVEVVGAFEKNEEARKAAEEKGVAFTYETIEELLKDETVGVVAIGDYYTNRGHLVLEALKHGKNVLCDKPLCTDCVVLEKIRKEAEKQKKTVGMCLSLRQDKNIAVALNAVQNGLIGKVNNIIFEGEHPLNYGTRPLWYFDGTSHGGVITDLAIHGIDMARLFTNSNLKTVEGARCWNFYATEVPDFKDSAQLMITMENGAGVIGDVSYSAPTSHGFTHPSYWHYRVWGEKGMLDFSVNGEGVTCYLAAKKEPIALKPLENCRREFDDFFDVLSETEEKQRAYTSFILDSMEQTLRIQKEAQ